MPLPIPYRFTPGTKADANEVNADFDAVSAKFQAGIVDGDCSPAMALDGNKMSQAVGKQIPNGAFGNNAVDARVLASDLSSDAARAVSGDHVKAWTAAHVARILAGASIIGPQLKTTTYSHASGVTVGVGVITLVSTGVTAANTVPLALYLARATAIAVSLTLHLDGGLWKFSVGNYTAGSLTVNAGEIKFVYVAAS